MSSQENQPGSNLASQEEIKNPTTSPEESIEAANEKKLSDTLEQSGSKVFLVTNEAKKVTPGQIARIENGGGSSEELNKRTSEVVQKIEAVNVETNQKVLGELMTQLSDWKAKMEKGSKSAPRAIKYTVDEVTKFCQKNGLPIPQEILDATPAPKEKPAKAEQSKVFKNTIPGPVEEKSNIPAEKSPDPEKIKNGISFLKDMYTNQAESVTRAMNEYYSAEKEFGADNPATQEKKKIWDSAFNARSETGAKIAEWIKDFPEYKDMFKADEQSIVEKPTAEQPVIEAQIEALTEQPVLEKQSIIPVGQKVLEPEKNIDKTAIQKTRIENVKSISQLYEELDKIDGVQGSQKFYSSKDLKDGIYLVMNNKLDPSYITNTYGLRDKIIALKNSNNEEIKRINGRKY